MDKNQANTKRYAHSGEVFSPPIPLIYVLHSGQLYGTERMTINLARSLLSEEYFSVILAPSKLVLAEASKYDITILLVHNIPDLASSFNDYLAEYPKLVFITTSFSQSILLVLCNFLHHRQIVHLHIVHGGAGEYLSYARKSLLNYLPVKLIAVSDFVRDRLLAHGVKPEKIEVIENFLISPQVNSIIQHPPFARSGIQNVLIVSRIDPIKRIDLLFDALDFAPQLNNLSFRIFGFGRDFCKLKQKAQARYPHVVFHGFSNKIFAEMAKSDLLLHLCPVEAFGMAVLEAMALGLPVLVPNRGGMKTLVENEISGFQFKANDIQDLSRQLLKLSEIAPEKLNLVCKNAKKVVRDRFSEDRGIAAYRKLFNF